MGRRNTGNFLTGTKRTRAQGPAAAALAASLALLGSAITLAEDVVIDSPITTTADDDDAVTVGPFLPGGEVLVGGSIENRSTVRTEGISADALRYGGIGGTVTNTDTGVIETSGDAFAVGIRVEGDDVDVRNDGSITTTGVNGDGIIVFGNQSFVPDAIGVDPADFVGSRIVNTGSVSVGGVGADAVVVEGDDSVVTNRGSIISSAGLRTENYDGTPRPSPDNGTGAFLAGNRNTFINESGASITASGENSTTIRVSDGGRVRNEQGALIANTGPVTGASNAGDAGAAISASGNDVTIENNGLIRGNVDLFFGSQTVQLLEAGRIEGIVNADTLGIDEFVGGPVEDHLKVTSGSGSRDLDGDGFLAFDRFTKDGGGTENLSGTLDLGEDGQARIDEGTLALNNGTVATESLLVGSGAALTGNGTISGNVFVQDGGVVGPGFSPGLITVTDDFVVEGSLLVEIAGLGPGEFDFFDVGGMADLSNALLDFSFIDGFLPSSGDTLSFLSAEAIIGFDTAAFGFRGVARDFDFVVDDLDNGLVFTALNDATAVPTPATLALLTLGGLVMVGRRPKGRAARHD